MVFTPADWTIGSNGNIRYTGDNHEGGSPSYATVIELHRALQDFADDAVASGDDLIDITDATPSDRSTDNIITLINGYNIDDTASEHLYDGSIVQTGGDTIYDGIVNFGNAQFINVLQNGSILANDFWNSFTPNGFNASAAQGISHRFLVKVRDGGADIDGRRLLGMQRELGFGFAEFSINGTNRGNNVLALSQSADLNNQTAEGTIATWTDVVNNNEGYSLIDVTGDGTTEPYYSEWDRGSRTINQFYERIKWLARRGSSSTVYGLSGEVFRGVTHELDIDNPTGTFQEPEAINWSGGTGQLLAIDSTTAGTKLWMQILTGVIPTDNQTITGGTSGATCSLNATVTDRPISIGGGASLISTGTAVIGPYGLGIEASDLTAAENLTDLTNTIRVPPNNVTFVVNGVISNEDRILVGPESGSALDVSQDVINGALSAGATSIVVTNTIPSDTPSVGDTTNNTRLRVFNGSTYDSIAYSSYTGNTYTVDSTIHPSGIPNDIADGANIFIAYIDTLADSTSESFTSVFNSPRSLFVRIRDGGITPIKTFETTATLGSAGGSVTVIRTGDE
jgi:hypothetical protein